MLSNSKTRCVLLVIAAAVTLMGSTPHVEGAGGRVVGWGVRALPAALEGKTFTHISAGYAHNLALGTDGTVTAWGEDIYGQCRVPAGLTNVIAVAAGGGYLGGSTYVGHSLALLTNGTVVAWGYNGRGQTNVPAGLTNVIAIAAGWEHGLALKRDGTLAAWGYSYNGVTNVPATATNIKDISAGAYHNLALKSDGTVVAWGDNDYGQTNIAAGLTNVVAIAAGGFHSSALLANGTVLAWGLNSNGATNVPAGLNGLMAIAAGVQHNLALRTNRTVVMWGDSYNGQCSVPSGLTNVIAIVAGYAQSVALKRDGTLAAWGWWDYGQSVVPAGLTNVVSAAASLYHSLGVTAEGTVVAWGRNDYGQTNIPGGLTNVVATAAGGLHSLALLANGTIRGWGYNSYKQATSPTSATNVSQIKAGWAHSLALMTNGTVLAWGANDHGQTNVPAGLSGVTAIAVGYYHNVALRGDGTVVTWGDNSAGQTNVPAFSKRVVAIAAGVTCCLALLEDGTVRGWGQGFWGQTNIPAGLTNVVAIAGGTYSALALKSDGTVISWGVTNAYGQPTVPLRATNVFAMAAGLYHSLVIQSTEPGPPTWTGAGGDGLWQNPANWSRNTLPGPTDDVVIDVPGTNLTITLRSAATVRSLRCQESLVITGAVFQVTGGTSVVSGAFSLSPDSILVADGSNTTLTVSGPVQMDGASLNVRAGAVLELSQLSSYRQTRCIDWLWQVSDPGSRLVMPSLRSLAGADACGWQNIYALNGGRVELGAVTNIPDSFIHFFARDANSVVDLSGLLAFEGVEGSFFVEARQGGLIQLPSLQSAPRIKLWLSEAGVMNPVALTNIAGGELRVFSAQTLNLSSLVNCDGATLSVTAGGVLQLPQVQAYRKPLCNDVYWQVENAGSRLVMPALRTLAGNPSCGWQNIYALSGARIELGSVTNIPDSAVHFFARDPNSVVDLSSLAAYSGTNSFLFLEADNGGAILTSNLLHLNKAWLTIRNAGSITISQLRSLTFSSVTIDGIIAAFSNLVDYLGTSFSVLNGGQIIFAPVPDLACVGILAPLSNLAGQLLTVSWTVTNAGAATATAPWQETLLLADNAAGNNAISLLTVNVTNSLAATTPAGRSRTVILPTGLSGNYWLAVKVDSASQVSEGFGETNNLYVAAQPMAIVSPDLQPSLLASAPVAVFGQPFGVTWTVRNAGTGPAQGNWSDQLWLSSASNSLSGARLLASANGSSLAANSAYTNAAVVTVPVDSQSVTGGFWLVAQADASEVVAESDEGNNLRSVPLALVLPPLPDLAAGNVVCPSNALPGEPIVVVWAVTNVGPAGVTNSVWREAVLGVPASGGLGDILESDGSGRLKAGVQTWGVFTFTNTLAAGEFIIRTQSVVVPVTGVAGDWRVVVAVDAATVLLEGCETNNAALAAVSTHITQGLTLQLPFTQIAEDAANPVFSCTVVRNGSVASLLTVALSSSDTNGIALPASVVIPAGQSAGTFSARVVRDFRVTGPRVVTLSALAAGYTGSTQAVTVVDVDLPRLSLAFATNAVLEGQSVSAVVSRDVMSTNPVTVVLQSSSPGRFSPPTYVTIPGGVAATNFSVLAVDNNTVEAFVKCSVSASASGFESASASATVLDNDLPGVTVTLASATVSEGAGSQATLGTVTRSIMSARSLSVDLESTNTAAALVPARVVIPANQLSVNFPVAAVNDDQVNGAKETFIRAWVLATSGGTRLYEGAGALLTVTDDDGPTLKVVAAKKLVAEGLSAATTLTITRNTPATNALAVALSSSDLTEATVPASVVIPAGTNSVTVNLTSLADGVTDGNQSVVITATAAGYVSGTETVVVSDTDLPDLVVSRVNVPAAAETDSYVSIGYRVVNQGLGPAGTNFLVRVYLAKDQFGGDKVLVSQAPFDGTIPVGLFFEQTVQARLPQAAGDYWAVVEVDAGQQIAEVLEDNNTTVSSGPVSSRAAYGAWVQTSLTNALANTPVPLSGRATNALGSGVAAKLVNLHILTKGTERVISALTDSSGNFSTTWQPLPGEAGFYQIFATHPGVSVVPVQDEFRLVGMRANPASVAFKAVEASATSGSVTIENLSDLPLTGLSVTVVSQPAGLQVGVNLTGGGTLPGGGTAALSYTVLPTTAQAYGNVVIRVGSAQGASVDVTLAVSVEPLRPRLVATPGNLVAGMARGRQAVVEFKLANEGGIPTGPIVIALPAVPWLTLATTNPLPPLLPGETNATTITLLLTPAADLMLGAYEGSLALNSSNASLTVPFNFRALSESKGDLRITAVDELTYYAVGTPNLAGASVSVRDAVTHAAVATGLTDANGQFLVAQLPEAYYEIELTADKHTTYRNTHLLMAGRTNEISAFLSRQVVTYTWTVEPIEIEDRYQITIETTFETAVPIPVITIDPPVIDLALITAAETQIMVTITNHGLIAANNMRLSFPTHPLWEFTPLITQVGTLPARSGLTIPLIIRKLAAPVGVTALSRGAKDGDPGPCHTAATGFWDLLCGGLTNTYSTSIVLPNARFGCGGLSIHQQGPSGPYGDGGGFELGGGNNPVYYPPIYSATLGSCQCLVLAVLSCVPGIGVGVGIGTCVDGVSDPNTPTPVKVLDCVMTGVGATGVGAPFSCTYSIFRCFVSFGTASAPNGLSTYDRSEFGIRLTGKRGAKSFDLASPYHDGGRAYLYALNSVTVSPDGVWINSATGPQSAQWFQAMGAAGAEASDDGRII